MNDTAVMGDAFWKKGYVEFYGGDAETVCAIGDLVSMSKNYDFMRNTTTLTIEFDQREFKMTNSPALTGHNGMVFPERIVHNGPALIVFWEDGTKTVVKCHDEDFDAEKGLAMALARKMWGRSRTVAMLRKVEEQ